MVTHRSTWQMITRPKPYRLSACTIVLLVGLYPAMPLFAQETGGTGGGAGAGGSAGAAGAPAATGGGTGVATPTTPGATSVPAPRDTGPNTPTPVPNTPTPVPNTPTPVPNTPTLVPNTPSLVPGTSPPASTPLPQSPTPPSNPSPGMTPSANSNLNSPVAPGGTLAPTGGMFSPSSRFTPNSRMRANTAPNGMSAGSAALGSSIGVTGANVATSGVPLQLDSQWVSRFGTNLNLGLTLAPSGNRMQIAGLNANAWGAAGFQVGDQILAVNRSWVSSPQELQGQLSRGLLNEGRAWVYVNRNGTAQWVNVDFTGRSRGMLGVRVLDQSGAVSVAGVYPGSFALRAGLQQGDEIMSVNGVAITSHDDLVNQLRAARTGNGEVSLVVRRNGVEQTIEMMINQVNGSAASQTRVEGGANMAPQAGTLSGAQLDLLRSRADSLRSLLGNLSANQNSLSPSQIQEAQSAANEFARILQTLNARR